MVKVADSHKQSGMTLLELLVAVALLSIIAVMAFASINTLVDAKQQMDDTAQRLNQENMVLELFSDDIQMATSQTLMTAITNSTDFTGEPQAIRLQRFNPYQAVPRQGLVNHLKERVATVLDVRWFVRDSTWYRATRPAVSTEYAPWQEQAMLPIRQIRCQYQTISGQLLDRWPPDSQQLSALPRSVRCRLTSDLDRQSDLIITPWQQIW